MVKIERLKQYQPEIATRVRELLIQLSRSGKDKGEISPDWFTEIANSPYHDLILAVEDSRHGFGLCDFWCGNLQECLPRRFCRG